MNYRFGKPKAMGNDSRKVTRNFNISPKLSLRNPLVININGENISKSVQEWINTEPCLIWDGLYSGQFELGRDSHTLLVNVIKWNYPEKYEVLQRKKLKRKALRKYNKINNAK